MCIRRKTRMRVRWVASNGISRVLVSEGVVDRFVPIEFVVTRATLIIEAGL